MWYVLSTIFIGASIQANAIGAPFRKSVNIYKPPIKKQNPFPRWRYCAVLAVVYMTIFLCWTGGYKDYQYYHFYTTGRSYVGICLIFFEAMVILPRVVSFRGNHYRKKPRITTLAALFLGFYRCLDILRWGFSDHSPLYPAGSVQTMLYMRFFYEYNKTHGLFHPNRLRLKIQMHWENYNKNRRMYLFVESFLGGLTHCCANDDTKSKPLSLVFGDGERESSCSSNYQQCQAQNRNSSLCKACA